MVAFSTRERVDAYWCDTLAIDGASLHTPGVRVFPNPPDRRGWRGVYVLAFDKAITVFAPLDLLDAVGGWVADLDADAALDRQTWVDLFGATPTQLHGPSVHTYRDTVAGLAELASGRRINPRDSAALAALRGALDAEEWAAAGFAADSAMLFGLFDDGERLLAAANLTPGPDAATDVSIVVHPDARGQGHGARIAATAARQAIVMHGIARLRAAAASPAMLGIATALGFEEYGRNLVVYLPG